MKNLILFTISLAMFMESVDATILNTAIPTMAHSLQVNPIDLKLALISYLLSLAIFIPISGWVADKFGSKRTFITALGIFTLSSFFCGLSHSLGSLVVARVIQGLGSSLTMPVGRLIIVRTCERHELISKMNIVVMVASLGLLLGPVLGGIITNHFSWRWIFWVNLPVGIMTMILAYRLLPEMPPQPIAALDKRGFIFFGAGLALLTFGLSALSETHIEIYMACIAIVLAILLLIIYALLSRHTLHPIVKVELLQYRTFRISILGNLFARLGFGGMPFLVPLCLQIGLGYSPQTAGLLLAPMALGVFCAKPLTLHVLRGLGYKRFLIMNTCLVGVALWFLSFLNPDTELTYIAGMSFLYGFLVAMQYTAMNSLAYAEIPKENFSSATSMMSTIQQLSQSFGVAIAAVFLRFFASHASGLTPQVFKETFITMAVMTVAAAVVFLQLRERDGQVLIDKI